MKAFTTKRSSARRNLALLALTALGACAAPQPVALSPRATPIAVALNLQPPRPQAPAGTPAVVILPPADASGRFYTINSNLSQSQSVWHLRSALNVAALGCRGADEATLIASYNLLLNSQKAELAAAYAAMRSEYKAKDGTSDWENQLDQRMTRLYNFFSQTFAHDAFCRTAAQVAGRVPTIAPGTLGVFATQAMPQLEAPFTDFFVAYAAYRRNLATWEAEYGHPVLASATTVAAGGAMLPLRTAPVTVGLSTVAAPGATRPLPTATAPTAAAATPQLPYAPVTTP